MHKKILFSVMAIIFTNNVHAGVMDWIKDFGDFLIPTAHAPDEKHLGAYRHGLTDGEFHSVTSGYNEETQKKFKLISNDLIYAKLSNAIYSSENKVDDWELLEEKHGTDGFHAGVYKNVKTGKLVISYEGTDPADWEDVKTDMTLIFLKTKQHDQAVKYFQEMKEKYKKKDIIVTGHSLGGSLAQIAALANGVEAITFNSASINYSIFLDDLLNRSIIIGNKAYYKSYNHNVRNYLMTDDIVNPGSKIWGLTGKNIGQDIFIDARRSDAPLEHSIKVIIDEMSKISAFEKWYSSNKQNFLSQQNLNTLSNRTQNNTSHFGTTTIPQYNAHNRKTVQENPYLAKGSAIIEAPADIVLNWGSRPADLDSHLTGPINAQSPERFHVNYQNKGSLNSNPNVLLYRDDTSHGVGSANRPEQTRINVTQPGVYNFYVHDFSNQSSQSSRALSNSGAVVSVHTAGNRNLPEGDNLGRKVTQFSVPKDKVGTVWHTFELDTRRNTIKPVNKFHNDTKVIK
ncbi:YqiA/YcfP family alpha/beta fold hydrolase [Conchiformibius kuhniae]|uniref:YqiA/YcfP family alpha/beta fold hydrolase n=1 Tax=Conchiformibius kuhniae TaxID=211502 RepID=A0A8T9MSI5_9NEIS|nr:YqiA/YcfP family alpha/beta fold hydrolase [Conchiformibius kuhniae]UOP04241.1 DUF2974 domain-containing protein [Conchiformibius kuhniae]